MINPMDMNNGESNAAITPKSSSAALTLIFIILLRLPQPLTDSASGMVSIIRSRVDNNPLGTEPRGSSLVTPPPRSTLHGDGLCFRSGNSSEDEKMTTTTMRRENVHVYVYICGSAARQTESSRSPN